MNPFTKFLSNLLNKPVEEIEREQLGRSRNLGHEPTLPKGHRPHRGYTKALPLDAKKKKAKRQMEQASRRINW